MPNYCYGSLSINASEKRTQEILDFICTEYADGAVNYIDFNKVIPMPDDIYRGPIGRKEEELYGKNNWYDWSIENWGTKWNAHDTEAFENSISFWTAWSPCSPVIRKLAAMFPDAEFDYTYDEDGMGFCGEEIYSNGCLVYDMEADMSSYFLCDEDEESARFDDYEEGREEEKITVFDKINGVTRGRIERRIDEGDCITLIKGVFVDARERLAEIAA